MPRIPDNSDIAVPSPSHLESHLADAWIAGLWNTGRTLLGAFCAAAASASLSWAAGERTPYPVLSAAALRDAADVPSVEQKVAVVGPSVPERARDDVPGFKGMDVWQELTYAKVGAHQLTLNLVVPKNAPHPVPLVVYIHGGGWGGLDKSEGFANGLPGRGFALAAVDYRLSGEAHFPAQIEDCKAAVRWLRANGSRYGCATEKIGAIGDSAGGHLVALLGVTAGNPALEGNEGDAGVSSSVQAAVDYFGPTNLLGLNNHSSSGPVAELLGGSVDRNPDKARMASPLFYVSPNASPFLIVHGDSDKLVPIQQSIAFYDALQKAGVPSQFYTMPNAGHGANNPHAFDMAVAWFEKYLR